MTRFARMRHHTAAARRLRRQPTEAERRLWQRLRNERLGIAFRRQHPLAGYILDFYAPAARLAVELDVGQHAPVALRDAMRTRALTARGVTVLRFWNNEVLGNPEGVESAILTVLRLLATRTPSLTLPLPGGGGPGGAVSPETLRLHLGERPS